MFEKSFGISGQGLICPKSDGILRVMVSAINPLSADSDWVSPFSNILSA
jgi:hypothetical protein